MPYFVRGLHKCLFPVSDITPYTSYLYVECLFYAVCIFYYILFITFFGVFDSTTYSSPQERYCFPRVPT